ncbi:MAG: hypothetical protein QXE23_02535 [Nitrososphaerota archaeon]
MDAATRSRPSPRIWSRFAALLRALEPSRVLVNHTYPDLYFQVAD